MRNIISEKDNEINLLKDKIQKSKHDSQRHTEEIGRILGNLRNGFVISNNEMRNMNGTQVLQEF
jgi:hypothetical protein